MNKKILIGSMLVVILLLLMPSIPAIQLKTIEDKLDTRKSELLTKLRDLDIEKIRELLNEKQIKFTPLILTFLICIVAESRLTRGGILIEIAWDYSGEMPICKHPIIGIRAFMLLYSCYLWELFWCSIYYSMGWDCPFC
ncbi:MAG: hypothetical protein JSW60_02225 [Thermoplasmatales archaeon]|nr:MAG: hypothetical protein JSW60_02225 [Thermoplasmatales archaeon]